MKETLFVCFALTICIGLFVCLFLEKKKNRQKIKYLKEEGVRYFFTICSPLVSKWEAPELPKKYFVTWVFDNECSIFLVTRKKKRKDKIKLIVDAEYRGDCIHESKSNKTYSLIQFETLLQNLLEGEYVTDRLEWVAYYSKKIKTSSLTVFK